MGGSASATPRDYKATPHKHDGANLVKPIGAPDSSTVQPATAFGALGFEAKNLFKDMASKVQLNLRCEDLPKICPVIVVVYCKFTNDEHWRELGMSEVCHATNRNPVFDPPFTVEFRAEVPCILRFEVYKVRDQFCVQELLCQKFVGAAEGLLVDILMARNQGNGWFTKELMNPKPKAGLPPTRIAIWAEEDLASKYTVSFAMVGKGLKSTDFWKDVMQRRADPYAVVHRTLAIPRKISDYDDDDLDLDEDGETLGLKCTPVYHTEVQRRTNCPRFKRVELNSSTLCMNNEKQEILVELFDFFRLQRHHYMGEAIITFAELQKAARSSRPLEVPICYRAGPRIKGSSGGGGSSPSSPSSPSSRTTTKDSLWNKTHSKDRTSSKLSKMSKNSSRGSRSNYLADRKGTNDTKNTNDSDASKRTGSSGDAAPEVNRICGKIVGSLRFEDVGVERRYSFLDYIRGGMKLRLMVAVDFTRSNVGPHHPDSFHYLREDRPSAYATAIRAVGDVMRSYASSDTFSAWGFGAKIPPSHSICSNCFSLTGDFFDPEISGVEGVLRAYQRALHVVRFHGPTKLAEVVRMGANLSQAFMEANTKNDNGVDMVYYVMLILTDGAIDDQMETIKEVAQASAMPLSIVVVGIGDEDFSFLQDLTAEVGAYRKMQAAALPQEPKEPDRGAAPPPAGEPREEVLRGPERNIVHFVPYRRFADRPSELAAAALSDLPREVVGYYTGKNVKPRALEKMEDKNGNPLPITIPSNNHGRTKTLSKQPAGSRAPSKSSARPTSPSSPGGGLLALPGSGNNSRAGTNSRMVSKLSNAGGEGGQSPVGSKNEELRRKLEQLPRFVQDERARLFKEAVSLGYDANIVKRALRDGVASNTLEVLVDNIVHAGYGKLPSYKEAAEQAIPDMEVLLPGQPFASMPVGRVGVQGSMSPSPFFNTLSEGGSRLSSRTRQGLARPESPLGLRSASNRLPTPGNDKVRPESPLGLRSASNRLPTPGNDKAELDRSLPAKGRPGQDSLTMSSCSSGASGPKQARARQMSTESLKAIQDGSALTRRSSTKSILVQSREGSKDPSRRLTKELTFNLGQNFQEAPKEENAQLQRTLTPQHLKKELASSGGRNERGSGRLPATGDLGVCGICLEAPVTTELLPCAHRVACDACSSKLGVSCPLCQGPVREVRKLA